MAERDAISVRYVFASIIFKNFKNFRLSTAQCDRCVSNNRPLVHGICSH